MGAVIAMKIPAKPIMFPHWAVPISTLSAIVSLKYAAKTKVCIMTKYELFAQSYNAHENKPFDFEGVEESDREESNRCYLKKKFPTV